MTLLQFIAGDFQPGDNVRITYHMGEETVDVVLARNEQGLWTSFDDPGNSYTDESIQSMLRGADSSKGITSISYIPAEDVKVVENTWDRIKKLQDKHLKLSNEMMDIVVEGDYKTSPRYTQLKQECTNISEEIYTLYTGYIHELD